MKPGHTQWSRHYQTALRKHLEQNSGASLNSASKLGSQALALGLETLDVAGFHEQALLTLDGPNGSSRTRQRRVARAKTFFDETIVPIEKTHDAALKADEEIVELNCRLLNLVEESAAATSKLEQGIAQRQAAETALQMSLEDYCRLTRESDRLDDRLREQTRTILSAQEDERKKTSCRLQDEIAQTLVAIQIKLLALKNTDLTGRANLSKEVAETQHIVRQFEETILRLTHETSDPNET